MTAAPRFATINETLGLDDAQLGLADLALLLARDAYPELDVAHYLARLDEMAMEARANLPAKADVFVTLAALNRYLFTEQGFKGNFDDYYDPRNSYLNEVLDRRTGIPITLSLVYIEVGRRLGLSLDGVSFPGHFLVKCSVDGGDVVLDPYSGGVSLGTDELEHRLSDVVGEKHAARINLADVLGAAPTRDILVRMLHNLKAVYMRDEELHKALQISGRVLQLKPGSSDDLRDRGVLYAALDCFRPALDDLRRYLKLRPNAADADDIRERVIQLQGRVAQLH
ncbi:MAG: tetratricopeptide repeat protein [Gammaproteobacteria bacterium]|nr:tetratricopeptide repeat protein [Gammaproteobacteria bacterium]MCP5138179.1 tetratricopeptide repeat protein [Gammaproteobacteria bacterium]